MESPDEVVAVRSPVEPPPSCRSPERGVAGGVARLWARPLWHHTVALVIVLLLGFLTVPDVGVFSHDEGAQALQAQVLATEGDWGRPHPMPEVAPEGEWFPSWSAVMNDGEHATLWRKPLYSWLGGRLWAVGGSPAFHLFSTVGAAVAAVLTALCARELDASLDRPALWLVGLASPLFGDGYLLIAHAVAAAAVAAMTLMLLRQLRDGRSSWGRLLVVFGSAIFAVMVRREALLLTAAMVTCLVPIAIASRQWRTGVMACSLAAATAIAVAVDELWTTSLSGRTNLNPPAPLGESSLLGHVARGFAISWLRPSYGAVGGTQVLALLVVMLGAGAVYLHRRGAPAAIQAALWWLTVVVVVARFLLGMEPAEVIPGLLPAYPVLVWALVGLRRHHLRDSTTALLIGGFVIFAGGVILTQHGDGGGRGWGGRYFAIGLPLVTVAAVALGRDVLKAMERRSRDAAVATVVMVTFLSGFQQVQALRTSHLLQDRLTQSALDVASQADPGDGGVPIVITPDTQMARSVWAEFDAARWLLVPYDEIPEAVRRLRGAGFQEAMIATLDAQRAGSALAGLVPPAGDLPEKGLWWYWVVDLDGR